MKYKTIVLLFSLLTSTFVFSQKKQEQEIKPGKPNALDKQYDPPKNSPLLGGTATGVPYKDYSDTKNFVKINFAMFARSTFALYYQRVFNEDFSIQGGVGYVYNIDKAQNLTGDEFSDLSFTPTTSSLSLSRIVNNGSFKQGLNPFLSASVRFRFSGIYSYYYYNDDNNNFIDLGIRFYDQRYTINNLKNSPYESISSYSKVTVSNICYTLLYGYVFEAGSKLVTSHEFYWGVGLRNSKYNAFKSTETYNGNNYVTVHSLSGTKAKEVTPMFMIGYVLGFGF